MNKHASKLKLRFSVSLHSGFENLRPVKRKAFCLRAKTRYYRHETLGGVLFERKNLECQHSKTENLIAASMSC